ncbi:MAG: hypothetical protein ABIF85_06910 [Nanoarchaeota archaeon]|nr:hypothetical protein [Nanoarchaeota archaeon]MBU4299848.1 hypothetical protein [Nanoarchaeota archaeon]MBU4451681.1 hypothetical protein [Nanoarchaeota archaeon]MCG2723614.1 hypothetical protein [archaeon]
MKYNITIVPAMVLSFEASAYSRLSPVWGRGSIEKDGTYVFRAANLAGL